MFAFVHFDIPHMGIRHTDNLPFIWIPIDVMPAAGRRTKVDCAFAAFRVCSWEHLHESSSFPFHCPSCWFLGHVMQPCMNETWSTRTIYYYMICDIYIYILYIHINVCMYAYIHKSYIIQLI